MSLNNWLSAVVGGQTLNIQFQWGHCRELQHKLGDVISWDYMARPAMADGRVEVSGYWTDAAGLNDRQFSYRYFAIAIECDRITGVREIDEQGAEQLDRVTDPAMGWPA